MTDPKPVLLLDVDGVLNVLHVGVDGTLDRGLVPHDAVGPGGQSYRLLIDSEVHAWLEQLSTAVEIVWCTTWSNASEVIAPLVGLPGDLRQVPMPSSWVGQEITLTHSAKTPYVRRWAAENGVSTLAWIDDDIGGRDLHLLLEDHGEGPALEDGNLFIRTSPDIGLTAEHVDAVMRWAASEHVTGGQLPIVLPGVAIVDGLDDIDLKARIARFGGREAGDE